MSAKYAFDQWCLPASHPPNPLQSTRVQRISEASHSGTGCPLLSETIRSRRLRLFGHVAHAVPKMDHCRALYAVINNRQRDWKRRRGHPPHTWTHTVEADLKSSNIASTQPGIWHRTNMHGANFCRQLCPVRGPLLMMINHDIVNCGVAFYCLH